MIIARLPAAVAAGPSRLVAPCRALHSYALRMPAAASPPPTRSPILTLANLRLARQPTPAAVGLRLMSTAPIATSTQYPPLRPSKIAQDFWPWRRVENPPPGTDEVERVVFARPGGMNTRMTLAMGILLLSGIVCMIIMPSPREMMDKGYKPDEDKFIMGLPMELFWTYMLTGFATVAVGTVMVSTLIYSRLIARVALVRQRPAGQPNAQPREFIRFSTNLGQMAGRKPRELPVDKFRTYVIMGEKKGGVRSRSPYIKVVLDTPRNSVAPVLTWDYLPYRLDFRETPGLDSQEGELVLSVARLEDLFGALKAEHDSKEMPKVAK